MKKTDELITKLTDNHKRVNRDYTPIIRTVLTFYTILFSACFILYVLNPFEFNIKNYTHAFEILTIFFLIQSFVYLGFKALVPGEDKTKALKIVGINIFLTLIVFLNRFISPQEFNQMRNHCELEAVAISLITTLVGHYFLRRNDFGRRDVYSLFLIITLPLIATFIMHGVCSLAFDHVFIYHFMYPLLIPIAYIALTKSGLFRTK